VEGGDCHPLRGAAIGRFFDAPPNIKRLAILVAAAARMRSLRQRAIDDSRNAARPLTFAGD
jgi:hypothetical protein